MSSRSWLWCDNCGLNRDTQSLEDGRLCCGFCGKILVEDNYSEEVTFAKDAGGQSRAQGTLNRFANDYSASRDRTLDGAYNDMQWMLSSVFNDDDSNVLRRARNFYRIALERNFTKGRAKQLVEAACLYVACRTSEPDPKPYLLIEFTEFLGRNVYELGAVYLTLVQQLSLQDVHSIHKEVDPSLFIHRFANRLLGQTDVNVETTALKIIASMKRDWMQTGRKPSGLCGAALYISAISHGYNYTKSHIVKVVHICEATLTKRLIEFESTESGSLTIDEFTQKAEKLEAELRSLGQNTVGIKSSDGSEVLCKHKGEPTFSHALCRECYAEFMNFSGELDGESEPPAFQRAQQDRMEKEYAEKNVLDSSCDIMAIEGPNSNSIEYDKRSEISGGRRDENMQFTEADNAGGATKQVPVDDAAPSKFDGADNMNCKLPESETLSDIEDLELDNYIHTAEETQYKKIIWEELNREYVEEQLAKEAAAAAAKEAYEAHLRNCPEEARKLAADVAAAMEQTKKERRQKRAAEAKNAALPQTAAEATRQMIRKKRLASKINYDVLDELFNDSSSPDKKKSRPDDEVDNSGTEYLKQNIKQNDPEPGPETEYEGGAEEFSEDLHYGNVEEDYTDNYGYDDDFF
ncbi:Transcription factor IIIB 90 kDa subunit [Heracleum sosnowskyi]|uniref:Transcription factor IIIB 90 kDa subunit n=1 Tax=Heracleum sosnowskyi TaxID=360622 RepID=A0AAD8H4X2_9APIA|nr:Transcription factor IIIB 90 kDa subunit [Heracleum sosnowskyi]